MRVGKHIKYFWYVAKHKYFVLIECFKQGLYWRGLVHDLSKFHRDEWHTYVNHFYGNKPIKRDNQGSYTAMGISEEFAEAWLHHIRHNKHHWQYWVAFDDMGGKPDGSQNFQLKIFKPSKTDLVEMICDWKGAAKAQGKKPDIAGFYAKVKNKMILYDQTRIELEDLIEEMKNN